MEKIEPKYYADGEDAYSMKMDLTTLLKDIETGEKKRVRNEGKKEGGNGNGKGEKEGEGKEEEEDGGERVDEGETVGEEGRREGKRERGERMRKVKVGRGLGVGDLVERSEVKS